MIASVMLALALHAINPCTLLDAHDIARILGWTVIPGGARTYNLAGGAGTMCAFDGREGTVLVTIPAKGSGLPVNDLTGDLGTIRTPLHDAYGFGAPVELGSGSALVHRHGHTYGITVQPSDAQFADDAQMRALARVLIGRLPHSPRHAG